MFVHPIRSSDQCPGWFQTVLAMVVFVAATTSVQGQVCKEAIEDCLEPHGFPGCSDVGCCEAICLLDAFCCSEWDENCVELADASCAGLCGAAASGSCFSSNGTPACNDRVCCEVVCLADAYCCENDWDGSCSLFAGFICEVSGGECGDPGTGDCQEPNGTPACEDAQCCQAVCAIDSSCCDGVWDTLCATLADQACGGLCVVGTNPSDVIEAEGCKGDSNDPCNGGVAEEILPTGAIAGSFRSSQDVDVLKLDLGPLDLDGDGMVRVRLSFNASSATMEFLDPDCQSAAAFELSSLGCLATFDNRCLPASVWWVRISPTGEVGPCEDMAWSLDLESADTCGTICGRPDSCLVPHAHPGCEDSKCCALVCESDPACCNWAWDTPCASIAADLCGGDPPENDLCETAMEIDEGFHAFSQLLSTSTGPESDCLVGKSRGGDVWFRYRSTCEGLIKIGTCSLADFDTAVDIYRGDCDDLVPVVCVNDDAFCSFDTASIFFDSECGVDYLIRVSGVDDSDGTGAIEVQCFVPPCGLCEADLDGDGVVGGADFGMLLSAWGPCDSDGDGDCDADLDGDGVVSGPDIGLMLVGWGDC